MALTSSSERTAEVVTALEQLFVVMHAGAEDAGLESLVELDVTFSQARLIMNLAQSPEPQPINELAERLGLSLAATGRNVEHLVRTGLVDRKEDPQDRRVRLVSLSTRGHARRDQFLAIKREHTRNFVARLKPEDQTRLLAALAPIIAHLAPPTDQEFSACP